MSSRWGASTARNENFRSLDLKPVNYHLRYEGCEVCCAEGGVPFDVVFFNAPVYPDGRQNTTSFFGRDSWTLGRRLTLNLGVRYTHTIAYAPEQTRDAASGPSDPLFPARDLRAGRPQHLEQFRAAPACGVRYLGRWQDRDQGRVRALRPYAPAHAGRAERLSKNSITYCHLPVARPEREQQLRRRGDQPRSDRARFHRRDRHGVRRPAPELREQPRREATEDR